MRRGKWMSVVVTTVLSGGLGNVDNTGQGVDWFSHDAGHLFEMLFGWKANPDFGPFHLLSFAIIGGFLLISAAWRVLYLAQQKHQLAKRGPYAYVRHPQYVGFILVMFGFLLQWPTILTLAMFPLLVWMYVRLAHTEEHEALETFGNAYRRYVQRVPGVIPRFRAIPEAREH